MTAKALVALLVVCFVAFPLGVYAQGGETFESLVRLLTLRDYNTRVVLLGTSALGVAAGVVGTFLLLRRRSLLADTVSHATLPGLCIAYFIGLTFWGGGRALPLLLAGAAISGTIGAGAVWLIRRTTPIKDDAALGIVLSVFFGVGVALLGVLSRLEGASVAGLETFIYGKPASMLRSDAMVLVFGGLASLAVCLVLFKEFTALCFDPDFAGSQGFPVGALDLVLMTLVVFVTVIGLQAVGLILVVAMLIVPAASARFWSNDLRRVALLAGLIGGAAGFVGTAISAVFPRSPAGAVIVLVAGVFFAASLLFGPARGVGWKLMNQWRLSLKVARQHVLRDLLEGTEQEPAHVLSPEGLMALRGGPRFVRNRGIALARREGLVEARGGEISLTDKGAIEARRILRNHRLWELYLIHYADIAPSHVDRDADMVEHVLGPEMVARLEQLLAREASSEAIPPSPHAEEDHRA